MKRRLAGKDYFFFPDNPSASRRSAPPFTQGRLLVSHAPRRIFAKDPFAGSLSSLAWLAGYSKAHLCAASSIRAMPENEKPPAIDMHPKS